MQTRHIILIIVIVLLVVLLWYNREKWKNMYKVEGGRCININNANYNALLSIYLWHGKDNKCSIKIGALSYYNSFINESTNHGTTNIPTIANSNSINIRNSNVALNNNDNFLKQLSANGINILYYIYVDTPVIIALLEGFLHLYLLMFSIIQRYYVYAFSENSPNEGYRITPNNRLEYGGFVYDYENYMISNMKIVNGQTQYDDITRAFLITLVNNINTILPNVKSQFIGNKRLIDYRLSNTFNNFYSLNESEKNKHSLY